MSYQDRKLTEALSGASRGGKTARALCPFCVDEGYSGRYKNLALTYQTGRWGCYRCKRWGYLKGSEYLIQGEEEGAPTTSGPPAGWQEIGARPTLATVSAWAYARSRGITSGTHQRVLEAVIDHAKKKWSTWFVICQVTKSGEAAGKNSLVHAGDCHLRFYYDRAKKSNTSGERLMSTTKNRFGSAGITYVLGMSSDGIYSKGALIDIMSGEDPADGE
jgi:hypothetical protein